MGRFSPEELAVASALRKAATPEDLPYTVQPIRLLIEDLCPEHVHESLRDLPPRVVMWMAEVVCELVAAVHNTLGDATFAEFLAPVPAQAPSPVATSPGTPPPTPPPTPPGTPPPTPSPTPPPQPPPPPPPTPVSVATAPQGEGRAGGRRCEDGTSGYLAQRYHVDVRRGPVSGPGPGAEATAPRVRCVDDLFGRLSGHLWTSVLSVREC
ncbi:hypothetical protein GGR56DRAFT_678984 [Xylariaceae sp. FL0804]|nr:hypothetical protein GGR56DRAFT_678984 [Xylariaceae sp. FL0804]